MGARMVLRDCDCSSLHPQILVKLPKPSRAVVNHWIKLSSAPPPTEPPDVWAELEFIFNEEQIKGRCDFTGRNYLRRPIRDNNNPNVREQTIVTGTGVGKTISFIIGICWKILFAPVRGLWVMPTSKGEGGSGTFVDTRVIPDIEATKPLADLLPEGQRRFKINKQHVRLGGAHFGFVGGNSATQVAGNRCGDIRMDETDKFPIKLKNEAGTGALVKNRTEGVTDFQIFDSSTPTIEGGIIWPRLLRSNLHLYFVPCPHCNGGEHSKDEDERVIKAMAKNLKGWMVYIWNQQFAAGLPKSFNGLSIPFAEVKWDSAAKGKDGVWNYAKVQDTAHFECPHCKGKIFDWADGKIRPEVKNWMDANGCWICVKPGVPKHVGYHASSMYAPVINQESTLGGRAVKFLSACESGGEDLRDVINSMFALPELGQGRNLTSIELGEKPMAQIDWVAQLTADFQKNYPYIWFVVRKWCAFRLLPPFEMIDGKPDFYELLKQPGNEDALRRAESLVDGCDAAWPVLAELMRFDSRTGVSPVVDFLIAKKITGERLCKMFEDSGKRTSAFRESILKAMKLPVSRGGDSELVAAGHCGLSGEYAWDELKEIIQQFEVGKGMALPGRCVGIDAGYAEKFDREVLRKCFESATEFKYYDPMSRNRPAIFHAQPIHNFCQPCGSNGWFAMKGFPINQRWNHGGIRNELNVNLDDPFFGTPEAGKVVQEVLEFPSGLFWLRKDDLRQKRSKLKYGISPDVQFFPKIRDADGTVREESNFELKDYAQHINEQYYDDKKGQVVPRSGKGGSQSRLHPYHQDDCENMQIVLATFHEFFEVEEKTK